MNKKFVAQAIALSLTLAASGSTLAEARNGFGINAGYVSHSTDLTAKGGAFDGATAKGTSSGVSVGLDYQFALNPSISINPFLMSSGESGGGDWGSDTKLGHGIVGLQARYWIGDIFIGGHVARYSEVARNNGTSVSANGGGFGAVIGWEDSKGGLYVLGQVDSATVKYDDADADISGVRISIGYRFK